MGRTPEKALGDENLGVLTATDRRSRTAQQEYQLTGAAWYGCGAGPWRNGTAMGQHWHGGWDHDPPPPYTHMKDE